MKRQTFIHKTPNRNVVSLSPQRPRKEMTACLPACWSMSGSTSWWQLWAGNTGGGWNITNTCHVVRRYHTLTLNPLHFTSRHDTLKIQSLLSGANNDRRHQWKQFWRNEKTLNYNDLVLLFLLHNGLKWRQVRGRQSAVLLG